LKDAVMPAVAKPVQRALLAIAMAAALAPAANAMDVATWLSRAEVLKAKGVPALFTSEYKVLQAEIKAGAATLEQERAAALAAGRPAAYCPSGKPTLSREEVFDGLGRVPAADRPSTDVTDALRTVLARKYPCKG
jgi:hypothetical protein